MGIDPVELRESEQRMLQTLVTDEKLYDELTKGQKLDKEIKTFIALMLPPMRNPSIPISKAETAAQMNALFIPQNWDIVSINSSLFLRFPDLSPLCPFRRILTSDAFDHLRNV